MFAGRKMCINVILMKFSCEQCAVEAEWLLVFSSFRLTISYAAIFLIAGIIDTWQTMTLAMEDVGPLD
jgi:hypothetical protein